MDWVAAMDQTKAALKTHAVMLKQFHDALVDAGFTADDAHDIVVVWYERALAQAADREAMS